MFEQYIGGGADIFITIVACIMGFAAAIGFMDSKKEQEEGQ